MAYSSALPRPAGQSLYSTLRPFPVACFVLTLLTDIAYWASASVIWETMSAWLLTIGLIVAGFALLAGVVDLVRSRTTTEPGKPWFVVGDVVAFGLSIVNILVHSRDAYTAVVPQGLALSFVVVLVLLATTVTGRSRSARRRIGGPA